MENKYDITTVSKLTGISQNLLRAWERRYEIIIPTRSSSNRRLYSEQDLEKLKLLRKCTEQGFKIGVISSYSIEMLNSLLSPLEPEKNEDNKSNRELRDKEYHLGNCFEAIEKVDGRELIQALGRASLYFGDIELIKKVVKPLLIRVNELAKRGILNRLQENLTFNCTERFLLSLIKSFENINKEKKVKILFFNDSLNKIGSIISASILSVGGYIPELVEVKADQKGQMGKCDTTIFFTSIFPDEREYLESRIQFITEKLNINNFKIVLKNFEYYSLSQNQKFSFWNSQDNKNLPSLINLKFSE